MLKLGVQVPLASLAVLVQGNVHAKSVTCRQAWRSTGILLELVGSASFEQGQPNAMGEGADGVGVKRDWGGHDAGWMTTAVVV